MEQLAGKALIIVGVLIISVGLIFYFGGGSIFSWIGNLPGDIRIEKENFSIYIPITTMIIFSVLLTLFFWGINRL